jgi:tRNA (guanine-N(7)-)-methyltransferase subunit TRM82
MPKRPCAIAFTPDETQILAADKFGDVYSLPLHIDPEVEAAYIVEQTAAAEAKAKDYVPAATELTVHSRANRKALEIQMKLAKENLAAKPKEVHSFSHKLELGHVSMLTDMLVSTLRPSEDVEKPRTYILTADRDEHIRVSRGPPQAHIIEGYCLGHHEFVNKLCLVEPGLLVSGGGDSEIIVWEWLEQKLLNRIDLLDVVKRSRLHIKSIKAGTVSVTETEAEMTEAEIEVAREEKESKIAVSGLWLFEDSSMETEPQLLITVEGIPAVLHIPVASLRGEKAASDISFLPLDGNVLGIALIGDTMIVSMDNIHQPGSITEIDSRDKFKPRVQAYQAVGEEVGGGALLKPYAQFNSLLTELNEQSTSEWHEKALQNLLYGVENLRKRGGQDDSVAE